MKKLCSVCGVKKKHKKLLDGYVCKSCLKKCGIFKKRITPKKNSVDVVKKAIMAAETNQKRLANFKATKKINKHISFDDNNRLWKFHKLFFRYEDIASVRTLTSTVHKTSGKSGSALAGGLLFGPIGAVVGSSGKRKTTSITNEYGIEIRTKNEFAPIVRCCCIAYKKVLVKLNSIIDLLNETVENASDSNDSENSASGADEIMKYKKLCDDGVITEEEFEAKKKQILGL